MVLNSQRSKGEYRSLLRQFSLKMIFWKILFRSTSGTFENSIAQKCPRVQIIRFKIKIDRFTK